MIAHGATRDCLDPWTFLLLSVDGSIRPCCWRPPTGQLKSGESADSIANGDEVRALRARLLTGDPDELCAGCENRVRFRAATTMAAARLGKCRRSNRQLALFTNAGWRAPIRRGFGARLRAGPRRQTGGLSRRPAREMASKARGAGCASQGGEQCGLARRQKNSAPPAQRRSVRGGSGRTAVDGRANPRHPWCIPRRPQREDAAPSQK
jgi:hypothetical protein